MTGSVRVFFALRFRAARRIRQVLDDLDSMGRPVKPVAASGLHVTLKFLGETPTRDLPMLQRALRSAVRGQSAFDVALRGVGAFPRAERPAVVWLGLSEDGSTSAPSVESLANQFEHRLTALGVPAENRAFHPHLTLARIRGRPPRSLLRLITDLQNAEFGRQTVTEVHLMATRSTGRRTAYVNLDSILLGTDD